MKLSTRGFLEKHRQTRPYNPSLLVIPIASKTKLRLGFCRHNGSIDFCPFFIWDLKLAGYIIVWGQCLFIYLLEFNKLCDIFWYYDRFKVYYMSIVHVCLHTGSFFIQILWIKKVLYDLISGHQNVSVISVFGPKI